MSDCETPARSAAEEIGRLLAALSEIPLRISAVERQQAALAIAIASLAARLPPLLMSVRDAARTLDVSESTVRRWVKKGEIPVVRIEGTVRVDVSRLTVWDE